MPGPAGQPFKGLCQPQTEAFISPDSIINPDDPQDLNAYAYASDNPATDSDPSGQCDQTAEELIGSSCPAAPTSLSSAKVHRLVPKADGGAASGNSSSISFPPGCDGTSSRAAHEGLCNPLKPSPTKDLLDEHWRGAMQVELFSYGGLALAVCTAGTDGLCIVLGRQLLLNRTASVLISNVLFGAGQNSVNYALSGGGHSAGGYGAAAISGGAMGEVGGVSDLALGGQALGVKMAGGALARGGAIFWYHAATGSTTSAGNTATSAGVSGGDSVWTFWDDIFGESKKGEETAGGSGQTRGGAPAAEPKSGGSGESGLVNLLKGEDG